MKRTFRKILAVLFSGALLMAAGCGAKEKIVYSPALPGEAKDDYTLYLDETFNSTADLSDCQGYRNWYYYCGDPEDDSLSLMVFNLIPIYPLDGSHVLESLCMRRWPKFCWFLRSYGRYIMLACLVLGLVGEVLSPVVNWFYGWMSQVVFFVFGVA